MSESNEKLIIQANSYPILQYFAYDHLPPHLQEVSKGIGDLAAKMVLSLPACEETQTGLRKLLEAKDCFVRANLSKGK